MMVRTCGWIEKVTEGKLVGAAVDSHLVIRGVSTDSRKNAEGSLFVPLKGDNFDGHHFVSQAVENGALATLWKKDAPLPQLDIPVILVEDPLTALQAMARAYREELGIPIVAITGSNGKTTTKDLVSSVLSVTHHVTKTQGNLNNHIGVPLTLLSMSEETEIGIVEMGMNHKGEISLLSNIAKPNLAVITNIGESHLEYLGTREAITEAKLEIIDGLKQDGTLFVNGDEPLLQEKVNEKDVRTIRLGFYEGNEEYPSNIQIKGLKGSTFCTTKKPSCFELPLIGRHNVLNALFAIQMGRHFQLSEEDIRRGLAETVITGMRLEVQRAKNGMLMINDAYNASPTSMKAAIDLHQEIEPNREKWVLFGDIREIGEQEEEYHREIGAYAIQKNVDRIYTIGKRGRWIAEGAIDANHDQSSFIRHFDTQDEAFQQLLTEGNPNVLLLVKASKAMCLDQVVQKLQ